MPRRKVLLITLLVILVVLVILWLLFPRQAKAPTQSSAATPTNQSTAQAKPSGFDKQQYPLDNPASIWVVVNKQRPLNPVAYAPTDLTVPNVPLRVPGNESMQVRAATAKALQTLFADAKQQGLNFMLSSGYRSYSYQVSLYNGYVSQEGQAAADQASARPGHSEHQTGLAADLEPVSKNCEVTQCFADTPEGKWLAANAYKYGFILRYPADKMPVTGYEYEPWHIRYVGTVLSAEMHNQHIETLEEFFGLPAAPNYSS